MNSSSMDQNNSCIYLHGHDQTREGTAVTPLTHSSTCTAHVVRPQASEDVTPVIPSRRGFWHVLFSPLKSCFSGAPEGTAPAQDTMNNTTSADAEEEAQPLEACAVSSSSRSGGVGARHPKWQGHLGKH